MRFFLVALLVGGVQGCCASHVQRLPTEEAGAEPDAAPPDSPPDVAADPDAAVEDAAAEEPAPDADVIWDGTFPDVGDCHVPPATTPFLDPVQEINWNGTNAAVYSAINQVCMTPLAIDLTGDGQPEIVFTSYGALAWENGEPGGVVRVVDGRSGETLWSIPNDESIHPYLEATANLAAGDLDGDGVPEIVGLTPLGGSIAFHADGTIFWQSFYPTLGNNGVDPARESLLSGAPAIADLDGDGLPEVVVGRTAINGQTGQRLWSGTGGVGKAYVLGPISCVADLDGDGRSEVIAGNTVYDANGDIVWQAPLDDGFCGVADITSDPGPEIVLVATGHVHVLSSVDGTELWSRVLPGNIGLHWAGGAPTIADFDGDGQAEIGIANGNAYTVFDLGCSTPATDPGCAGDGIRWSTTTDDSSSSATGSSVFDFDGDGAAEVIYNDQRRFRIYDGRTGAVDFAAPNSSRTRTEYPIVADVNNDGSAEIVFPGNDEASFLWERYGAGVQVWGSAHNFWVGARRVWNEHTYHVTNVTESGGIPAREDPSWATLNAYRQNLAENRDPLTAPDLRGIPEGPASCTGGGQAVVVARVENGGTRRVGAGVVVGIHQDTADGPRVGSGVTVGVIDPGGAEDVAISFAVVPGASCRAYWGVIDDGTGGGAVRECSESDNVMYLGCVACP